ncbi:MAG: Gldg family protein [Bacteroidia bacterium]|nr:Gldg family protein [Bacteroidia bacterium]MDW8301452.1 Gldg family protein [Bacteroidia bacterium]
MKKLNTVTYTVLIILILFLLNILLSRWVARIDLTREKRFTLSASTKKLLRELKDPVFFKIYLESKNFPTDIQHYRNSIKYHLDVLKAYAGSNIQYQFVDPSDNKDLQVRLAKEGMIDSYIDQKDELSAPTPVSYFPALSATYRGREIFYKLVKGQGKRSEKMLNAEQNLEYDFSAVIKMLQNESKPQIAFLRGQGELDFKYLQDLKNMLRESYDITEIDLRTGNPIPLTISALIVMKPQYKFSERVKYEIDQYLMNGGNIIWCIDPIAADFSNNDSLAFSLNLNLKDMFLKYGFRVNENLVQDLRSCGKILLTPRYGTEPTPVPVTYYPKVVLFPNHPTVSNLVAVNTFFASSIDTVNNNDPDIRKTPVLVTSPYSRATGQPIIITIQKALQPPTPDELKQFTTSKIIGLALEGKFTSVFENRQPPIDSLAKNPPKAPMLTKGKYARMLVIGDGDIVLNKPLPNGSMQPVPKDNLMLIKNTLDWMTLDEEMIALRGKTVKVRLLDTAKVKKNKKFIQMTNVTLPILVVTILGVLYYQVRKRRFAK